MIISYDQMKVQNEYINLKLHSLEQAMGIIDCLFDNGYRYRNYSEEDSIRESIHFDITHKFRNRSKDKKVNVYYIEIDNEMKDFLITSKLVDIVDLRMDKIKKIKDGL